MQRMNCSLKCTNPLPSPPIHRTPHAPATGPVPDADEFHVAIPGGFPDHRGFETITYLLPHSPGKILHEDFCGHKGELARGDLQWMFPGRGNVHSKMPASRDAPAIGLQLWLNLPARLKMTDPKYIDQSHHCRMV
ncbi:hypothetical protein DYB32_010062 [Aphanomyces invadans]|uniref:Pirin N-terminal domain-containing protein n=1 Tax=Aphanomyces invadans TaxID=157072 RepID=A0A418AGW5_9STRA|nr:hypothetical protein DYB32_010062 [Aphanomyces invadans]